ncbi:MAG: Ku protein [Oscillospiraceae bacterium]|nr:Ku protein [Oscillospiraceae bacterium]
MPATKTVLSFGLVAIPIALHTATQENDIGFRQLHKADHSRIRYKKVCEGCNKEVKQSDIVRGYEYEKDHYVIVSDEELEAIKTEKEKAITILHFVQESEISSICYAKAYYAQALPGGEKAFELLRQALQQEQRVAVGKTVLSTKETLMAIFAQEDGLLLQTMFFADEIKAMPAAKAAPKVTAQELNMAKKLLQTMDAPFDLADYHDEYQAKLRQLLESKITGEDMAMPKKTGQVNVADLMDAFRQSIEQQQKPAKKKPQAKKAAKK